MKDDSIDLPAPEKGSRNQPAANQAGQKDKHPRDDQLGPGFWFRFKKRLSPAQWKTFAGDVAITIWLWIYLLESHDVMHLVGFFAALLLMYAGAWYFLSKLFKWKSALVICLPLILVAILVAYVNSRPSREPSFSVVCGTQLVQSRDRGLFWWAQNTPNGWEGLPIPRLMFVHFANLKPIPAMIDSYSVETRLTNGFWEKAIPIPAREDTVFMIGADPTKAKRVEFTPFSSIIHERNVAANEVISGWIFLSPTTNGFGSQWRFRVKYIGGGQKK